MADNIKTVSSDNLARFKQKCDETYAKIGEGGGSDVEIPTPTTSDNGKVLGVANGAYELQEASGGGGGGNTGYTVTKSGVLVNSETFICEHADGTITELSRQSSASAQNVVKVYITADTPPGSYTKTTNAKNLVYYSSSAQFLFIYSIVGDCTFSYSSGGGGEVG